MTSVWNSVTARILMAILVLPMASSCTVLSPVQPETRKWVVNQLPLEIPQKDAGTATLLVLPPDTKSAYDTVQMAYTAQPYQIDYFSRHEWSATPSQMLHPLLVTVLENTHHFSAVVTPPYTGHYTYTLQTEILEFAQDFTAESAALRFTLRCQLSDGTTGRVIGTKEIALREPMRQDTPYAGVVAANNATAKALLEVARFVLEKTN